MIRICYPAALAVCFISVGLCFVIEPIRMTSPHRRSSTMKVALRLTEDDSNRYHSSVHMEMSRRSFLVSSLAAIAILPSSSLAANSPLDVSDEAIPYGDLDLKGKNSTLHTHGSTSSRRGSGSAKSDTLIDKKKHHGDENNTDGHKRRTAEVKPNNRQSFRGKTTPPRIKGIARSELFSQIVGTLV